MIVLHQFEAAFGVPNPSPFCMKLECFLRMSGLPYRSVPLHDLGDGTQGQGSLRRDRRRADRGFGADHPQLERRYGIDPTAG